MDGWLVEEEQEKVRWLVGWLAEMEEKEEEGGGRREEGRRDEEEEESNPSWTVGEEEQEDA